MDNLTSNNVGSLKVPPLDVRTSNAGRPLGVAGRRAAANALRPNSAIAVVADFQQAPDEAAKAVVQRAVAAGRCLAPHVPPPSVVMCELAEDYSSTSLQNSFCKYLILSFFPLPCVVLFSLYALCCIFPSQT